MFLRLNKLSRIAAPAGAAATLGAGGWWLQNRKSCLAEASSSNVAPVLSPKAFKPLKVTHVEALTWDSRIITVEADAAFPACTFALFKAPFKKDGKPVVRPYTPISSKDGKVSFAVKVYPDGTMSKHCGELRVGDTLDVKGPMNKMAYTPNMKSHVGLVAGGSGITPMLQIINAALELKADDNTKLHLLFANKTADDIMFFKPLQILSRVFPDQLSVHYMVSRGSVPDLANSSNTAEEGHVTKQVLAKTMPPATLGDNVLIVVCGPPGFNNAVAGPKAPDWSQGEVAGYLKELGYTKSQVFKA